MRNRPSPALAAACLATLFAVVACGNSQDSTPAAPAAVDPTRPALCSRAGDDAVRDVFCTGVAPRVTGFEDLHGFFRLDTGADEYGQGGLTGAAAVSLGHSTALSGHVVSPINPRVILPGAEASLFLAFQRGVQKVEIIAPDRIDRSLNFYLVTFQQACNQTTGGCTSGDLYTPAIEKNWTQVTLEDDDDLKNTQNDCRQCHRRGTERPSLLMRELQSPWTHFFGPEDAASEDIMLVGIDGGLFSYLYRSAKEGELYAGLPLEAIQYTSGFALQLSVPQGQPLLFDSGGIMNEHFPYKEGMPWPGEPQRSAIWDREYEAFKRGEHLALPYFDALVTDPAKLTTMTRAYRDYLSGAIAPADLPDLADIHPDDPRKLAEIGLLAEPDASAPEALIQACGTCHNDVLDQTISRARFNVAVPRLDQSELAVAVDRLSRSPDEPGVMPPREARQLTPEVRARLVDYLNAGTFPAPDRDQLEHAATVGMAQNSAVASEPSR